MTYCPCSGIPRTSVPDEGGDRSVDPDLRARQPTRQGCRGGVGDGDVDVELPGARGWIDEVEGRAGCRGRGANHFRGVEPGPVLPDHVVPPFDDVGSEHLPTMLDTG